MNLIRTAAAIVLVACSTAALAAPAVADGEIRKVDKDAAKLTIRHGELKDLGMPPMTMVFRVQDKAMLGQVEAGDKVRFTAAKVDGVLTVTTLESAK
ncbi:copper-binding protein [Massilia sp. TSP1-1-2]|uniref:copper-binding protein n=1 Tax=Massilia sp. TSP1-1-2 TaxID=2804649 RepID=UPI003CEA4357